MKNDDYVTNPSVAEPAYSRKGLGVVLGFFFGYIGLGVALLLYDNDNERKSFISGWIIGSVLWTIIITIIIAVSYSNLLTALSAASRDRSYY